MQTKTKERNESNNNRPMLSIYYILMYVLISI